MNTNIMRFQFGFSYECANVCFKAHNIRYHFYLCMSFLFANSVIYSITSHREISRRSMFDGKATKKKSFVSEPYEQMVYVLVYAFDCV